jgi:hypothetical protein
MMAFRLASTRYRLMELLSIMSADQISTKEKVAQLREELSHAFHKSSFGKCNSMGQLVKVHLKETLRKNLMLISKALGKFND